MKNIFIINHGNKKSGSMNYLEDYLLRNKYNVSRLTHPLDDYDSNQTQFFIDKKIQWSKKRKQKGFLNFVGDFFRSLFIISSKKFDVFIGANSFDMLPAIFFRLAGKKMRIIFFGSDFSEDRFGSKILNKIYRIVEKISVRFSDLIISNTTRAEKARLRLGMRKNKSMVIPNGIYIKNKIFKAKPILKDHFIYEGSVTREHGLFEMIENLSPLIKKLVIIGQGSEWQKVIELCQKLNINLETHYQKEHQFVIEYMQKFQGFGLAPYNSDAKWTYYCSPSKIGEYIATGVPVIVSSVPEFSSIVKEQGLGIVYDVLDYNFFLKEIGNFSVEAYHLKSEKFYEDFERDKLYEKIEI